MSPAFNIRHIVVAHDFSEAAEHALAYAIVLAEKFDAEVTVVNVYEIPPYGHPEAFVANFDCTLEVECVAASLLAEIEARTIQGKVRVDTSLRRGIPWAEINAAATESKADLIVIGTNGRRGVARALLGSVAEKVVRTAPCPVLTVHVPEAQRTAGVAAQLPSAP